jgi:hypothetical protein
MRLTNNSAIGRCETTYYWCSRYLPGEGGLVSTFGSFRAGDSPTYAPVMAPTALGFLQSSVFHDNDEKHPHMLQAFFS